VVATRNADEITQPLHLPDADRVTQPLVIPRAGRVRYLRPRTPAPLPPRRGGKPGRTVARWLPALLLCSIVSAVITGRGFWPEDGARPVSPGGATDNITASDSAAPPVVAAPDASASVAVTGPGGQTVIAPSPVEANSLGEDFYQPRPALTITTAPQRIDLVRVRRDETLNDIAGRSGVTVNALLYANDLTDPDAPLPVGLAVKVPPKGTMLHRVKESDTLEGIAKAYRVRVDDITNYPGNDVKQTADLVPGSLLLVPTDNLPLRTQVVFYQVREGDSLGKITARYGLRDPLTVAWANSLPNAGYVTPGQVIAIPPADGVIYVVTDADTQRNTDDAITQIAKGFACTAIPCRDTPSDAHINDLRDAVFSFGPNHLTRTGRLIPGQEIIIPGGIPYVAPPPVVIPRNPTIDNPVTTAINTAAGAARPAVAPPVQPVIAAPGTKGFPGQFPATYYPPQGAGSGRNPGFVWPEIGTITSTYNPAHNGIDIATTIGTPLHAAAAGYVVYAGWTTSGLGIAVYIDHGNGFVTVYGHMSDVAVQVGQYVDKGEYIGPEGSTGNSTGPHCHFMVIENNISVNPFNYLPG